MHFVPARENIVFIIDFLHNLFSHCRLIGSAPGLVRTEILGDPKFCGRCGYFRGAVGRSLVSWQFMQTARMEVFASARVVTGLDDVLLHDIVSGFFIFLVFSKPSPRLWFHTCEIRYSYTWGAIAVLLYILAATWVRFSCGKLRSLV